MNCPTCDETMTLVKKETWPTKSAIVERVVDREHGRAGYNHYRSKVTRRTMIERHNCTDCNWKWQGQRTWDVDEPPIWSCNPALCTVEDHFSDLEYRKTLAPS